jgi:hypothetical protein
MLLKPVVHCKLADKLESKVGTTFLHRVKGSGFGQFENTERHPYKNRKDLHKQDLISVCSSYASYLLY